MPTVTELTTVWSRRHWLAAAGLATVSTCAWPAQHSTRTRAPRWAAAWQRDDGQHQIGWLSLTSHRTPPGLQTLSAIDVPTRAHGLCLDPQGRLLAAARRPGDWLLRWSPGQAPQWHWLRPDRSLNGHLLTSPDGRWLLSTETDLDTGAGWVSLRDAHTLALQSEWPTHGQDPHQLVWDRLQPGCVMVANGGITTRPETGRAKVDLAHMDSSLIRLNLHSGQVEGQWRLDDPHLSLRHLAWNASHLGIALQAEHADRVQRDAAPVFAVFNGHSIQSQATGGSLSGYGGDVAAVGAGFAVGCPRAGGVAWFDGLGDLNSFTPLAEACALASDLHGNCWAAGHLTVAQGGMLARTRGTLRGSWRLPDGLRLDNHWLAVPGSQA